MTKSEKAKQNFLNGYNCAQAVALAYCDELKMEPELVAKLSSGFGGGIGRMREVCGSVSGAVVVLSYLYGYSAPKAFNQKKELYQTVQEFCKAFENENGSIICRELLGLTAPGADSPTPEKRCGAYYKKRPCAELLECSAKLLDELIKEKGTK